MANGCRMASLHMHAIYLFQLLGKEKKQIARAAVYHGKSKHDLAS